MSTPHLTIYTCHLCARHTAILPRCRVYDLHFGLGKYYYTVQQLWQKSSDIF